MVDIAKTIHRLPRPKVTQTKGYPDPSPHRTIGLHESLGGTVNKIWLIPSPVREEDRVRKFQEPEILEGAGNSMSKGRTGEGSEVDFLGGC